MNVFNRELSFSLLSLNRYLKRLIAICTDVGLSFLCTWLAFTLRLEVLILPKDFNIYPALFFCLIAIPVFWAFGLYRTVFRYTGFSIVFTVLLASFVYGFLYFLIIGIYGFIGVPRSIGILQPMLLFFFIILSRLSVRYVLTSSRDEKSKINVKKNVLIYGAGSAGRQLVIALENNLEFNVIGFLDDNYQLHRQLILGKTIYNPLELKKIIKKKKFH